MSTTSILSPDGRITEARKGYRVVVGVMIAGLAMLGFVWLGGVRVHDHPLRLGTNLWVGYEPLHLAKADGRLPDLVTVLEARSTSTVMEALKLGSIDGAALTIDEVLRLSADGVPLTIVAVLDVSRGADVVLAADMRRRDAGIRPGVRIGVERGAVGGFMLHRLLELKGIRPEDVSIVDVRPPEHEEAFATHGLDFLITYEPLASRLLAQGAKRLFDSAEIAGEVVDVLAIRTQELAKHRATVAALVEAWFSQIDAMQAPNQTWLPRLMERQALSQTDAHLILGSLDFPDRARNALYLKQGGLNVSLDKVERWLRSEGIPLDRKRNLRLDGSFVGAP